MKSLSPEPSGPDPFARLPTEVLMRIRELCDTHFDLDLAQISRTWFRLAMSMSYRSLAVGFRNVIGLYETLERFPFLAEAITVFSTDLDLTLAHDIVSTRYWSSEDPEELSPAERVFLDRRRYKKIPLEVNGRHIDTGLDKPPTPPGAWWSGMAWGDTFAEIVDPPCEEEYGDELEECCKVCYVRLTNPAQLPWQYPPDFYVPGAKESAMLTHLDEDFRLTSGPTGEGPIEGLASWDDWHKALIGLLNKCRPKVFIWESPVHGMPKDVADAVAAHDSVTMLICRAQHAVRGVGHYIRPHLAPVISSCEAVFLDDHGQEDELLIETLAKVDGLKHLSVRSEHILGKHELLPLVAGLHSIHTWPKDSSDLHLSKGAHTLTRFQAATQLRPTLIDRATTADGTGELSPQDIVSIADSTPALSLIAEDMRQLATEISERWNSSDRQAPSADPLQPYLRNME